MRFFFSSLNVFKVFLPFIKHFSRFFGTQINFNDRISLLNEVYKKTFSSFLFQKDHYKQSGQENIWNLTSVRTHSKTRLSLIKIMFFQGFKVIFKNMCTFQGFQSWLVQFQGSQGSQSFQDPIDTMLFLWTKLKLNPVFQHLKLE